jgi:hypothetical protein
MREALVHLRTTAHHAHRNYTEAIELNVAGEVYDAFAVNVGILGGTGAMAGTDDAGTAWATSYDARAKEVLETIDDLTMTMQNYGGVVIQAGYNHAVAEHNATAGQRAWATSDVTVRMRARHANEAWRHSRLAARRRSDQRGEVRAANYRRPRFPILQELFEDAGAYVAYPELRTEPEDLTDEQLRECAVRARRELRELGYD